MYRGVDKFIASRGDWEAFYSFGHRSKTLGSAFQHNNDVQCVHSEGRANPRQGIIASSSQSFMLLCREETIHEEMVLLCTSEQLFSFHNSNLLN
jgi:hypothetical protein